MHAPTFPNGTHPNGRTHSPTPAAAPPPGPDAKPLAAAEGRDTHGRFAQGNAGGPGNPFARRVAALRSALLAAVTEADLDAIARTLAQQAKDGNVAAARLLLSYALGKPAAAVDPDTLDLQEWEIYRRQPDPGPDMAAATQRPTLPFALDYLRALLPSLTEGQRRQYLQEDHAREFEEQLEAAARAERRARREAKRAQKTAAAQAPPDGPAKPAADEEALALLGRLLNLTPPSANGVGARPDGVKPPSANGRADFTG
jgi:hypothetical protein